MKLLYIIIVLLTTNSVFAQQGNWVAQIRRPDGNNVIFNFEWKSEKGKSVWYIRNAAEKIRVDNITQKGDSFIVQMPVFESQFRYVITNETISGNWIKMGAVKSQVLPFTAYKGNNRFAIKGRASKNITGRWAVKFLSENTTEVSVAEFVQKGNLLTGTFLNATGDYRYLEGVVSNDSLLLSGFDGVHAFLFRATIQNNTTISNGKFYSGARGIQNWTAIKNSKAKLPMESVAMQVKPGEEGLDFSFKDLDGKEVAINSERFKNKVVIVQLLGSWCPNCMDETAFLSAYYNNNKHRGVEVIGLAYEYTTDLERSTRSLRKFQQRFNVQYPILNTGVAVTDSLRTEKTLPQVTAIKTFPSSIIIDKNGKIRKLDTGFNGPATGIHYTAYKKEFEALVDKLLKEAPATGENH